MKGEERGGGGRKIDQSERDERAAFCLLYTQALAIECSVHELLRVVDSWRMCMKERCGKQ